MRNHAGLLKKQGPTPALEVDGPGSSGGGFGRRPAFCSTCGGKSTSTSVGNPGLNTRITPSACFPCSDSGLATCARKKNVPCGNLPAERCCCPGVLAACTEGPEAEAMLGGLSSSAPHGPSLRFCLFAPAAETFPWGSIKLVVDSGDSQAVPNAAISERRVSCSVVLRLPSALFQDLFAIFKLHADLRGCADSEGWLSCHLIAACQRLRIFSAKMRVDQSASFNTACSGWLPPFKPGSIDCNDHLYHTHQKSSQVCISHQTTSLSPGCL